MSTHYLCRRITSATLATGHMAHAKLPCQLESFPYLPLRIEDFAVDDTNLVINMRFFDGVFRTPPISNQMTLLCDKVIDISLEAPE